jgi:hypothetical protein
MAQAEDMALTKQTALLSLEILSRNFAAAYPTLFLGATFDVVSAAMRHANPCVQGSALVCQAAICLQLGAKMVPKIPKFMPLVVSLLQRIFAPSSASSSEQSPATSEVKDGPFPYFSFLISFKFLIMFLLCRQMPTTSCYR